MKDFIQTLGIVIASITAIYGINTWRRELKGKKEHDLAEEVLALFYECRDNLRSIRSPFARGDEGSSRKADPNESEDETGLLNRAYVVFERFENYREKFNKLFSLRYRFIALFGKEAAQPIEDLRHVLNKVFVSAQMLPSYWRRQGRIHMEGDQFQRHLDEMLKHERIFWGTFSDKDELDVSVNKLVETFEATCSRIIRRQPWWERIGLNKLIQKLKRKKPTNG